MFRAGYSRRADLTFNFEYNRKLYWSFVLQGSEWPKVHTGQWLEGIEQNWHDEGHLKMQFGCQEEVWLEPDAF